MEVFVVVLIIAMFVNILLHLIGVYFLIKCRQRFGASVQHTYIINLSLAEVLLNFCSILTILIRLVEVTESNEYILNKSIDYFFIIDHTLLGFAFYMFMNLITIHKFCEIYYNIKYPVLWPHQKASLVTFAIWTFAILIFVCVAVLYEVVDFDYEKFDRYFFLILDFTSLFLVVATYIYIFYKYVGSKKDPVYKRNHEKPSLLKTFANSRFYVASLLVASFLLFVIIPDLLYEFVASAYEENERKLSIWGYVIAFLYTFSFTCDACIYLFGSDKVKQLLMKKMQQLLRVRRKKAQMNILLSQTTNVNKHALTVALDGSEENGLVSNI